MNAHVIVMPSRRADGGRLDGPARCDPDGGQAVFVVVEDVAQRRPVSVIDWPAARLIVTDGLEAGDRVILDATLVTDGQPVRQRLP